MENASENKDTISYTTGWLRISGSIILGVFIILLLCWVVAPLVGFLINILIDLLSGREPAANVTPTMLFIDYILSFIFVMIGCFVAIMVSKSNPLYIGIPIGIIGWLIYFTEVGGFPGMMNSEYSLWYEIPSFFQDILASALTVILYRKKIS